MSSYNYYNGFIIKETVKASVDTDEIITRKIDSASYTSTTGKINIMKPINAEAAALTKAKIIETTAPFACFPSPAAKSPNRRSPETIFSWRAAIQTMFLEEKWTGQKLRPYISGTRKKTSEKMPGTYRKNRMAVLWPGQKKDRMACWICILRQMAILWRIETVSVCFVIIEM